MPPQPYLKNWPQQKKTLFDSGYSCTSGQQKLRGNRLSEDSEQQQGRVFTPRLIKPVSKQHNSKESNILSVSDLLMQKAGSLSSSNGTQNNWLKYQRSSLQIEVMEESHATDL